MSRLDDGQKEIGLKMPVDKANSLLFRLKIPAIATGIVDDDFIDRTCVVRIYEGYSAQARADLVAVFQNNGIQIL